jgi:hypothetical protein
MKKIVYLIFLFFITNSCVAVTLNPSWEWIKNDTSFLSDFLFHHDHIYTIGNTLNKLDTNGQLIWKRQFKGDKIAFDNDNNIFLISKMNTPNLLVGATTLINHGGSDIILTKLDSNGIFLWAKNYGDSGNDEASEFCIDFQNNVYLQCKLFGLQGIQKISSTGALLWQKKIPDATFWNYFRHIAYSKFDSTIVVSGIFNDSLTIENQKIYSVLYSPWASNDVYVAKLSLDSNLIFLKNISSTYRSESLNDRMYVHPLNGKIFTNFSTATLGGAHGALVSIDAFGQNINIVYVPVPSSNGNMFLGKIEQLSGDGNNIITFFSTDNKYTVLDDSSGALLASYDIYPWHKTVFGNGKFYIGLSQPYFLDPLIIGKLGDSLPIVSVGNMPASFTFCSDTNVVYTSNYFLNNALHPPYTYSWAPSIGLNDSTILNPTFNISAQTTYTLTIQDGNNNSFQDTIQFMLQSPPIITVMASDTQICANDIVTLSATGASNFVWSAGVQNNTPFTPTISQTYSVIGFNGTCNSLSSIFIGVKPSFDDTSTVNICVGENFTFPDGLSISTIFSDTFHTSIFNTSLGCDSIIQTQVHVNSNILINDNQTICEGSSFTFPDGTTFVGINSDTSHTSNLNSSIGCDSIIQTHVHVNSNFFINDNQTICIGSSFTFPDGTTFVGISSDTSHTSNLNSSIGCDSLIQTNIHVNPTYLLNENHSVCPGSNVTFPDGTVYFSLQTDTFHTSFFNTYLGCDSNVNTIIHVNPSYSINESHSVCEGSNFTFPDGSTIFSIISDTTYTSMFITASGCDSLINTDIIVNPLYFFNEVFNICEGNDFTFPDGSTLTSIQTDTSHLSLLNTNLGCDSIISTQLNVQIIDTSILQNGNTLIANAQNTSYQWYDCLNQTPLIGENNQTFQANQNGLFAVILSTPYCNDTTNCYSVQGLSISNYHQFPNISISPNPAHNHFIVEIQHQHNSFESSLILYNQLGQIMLEKKIDYSSKVKVDTSQLSQGIYYLKFANKIYKIILN